MRTMSFNRLNTALISAGLKTQTRRLIKKANANEILLVNPRILIKVTSVYAEPLQDISIADCLLEGCVYSPFLVSPLDQFIKEWESIYGTRPGYAWINNPLIWVHHFHVVKLP